jgi:hypothetical protein
MRIEFPDQGIRKQPVRARPNQITLCSQGATECITHGAVVLGDENPGAHCLVHDGPRLPDRLIDQTSATMNLM